MFSVVTSPNSTEYDHQIQSMFRHRKRMFVDMLGWSVPVVDGEFEQDEFDTPDALYILILDDETNEHLGSVRLLQTSQPHILGNLFPELCVSEPPCGPDVYEITRLCFAPRLRTAKRAEIRNVIATALVEFGLLYGVRQYVCVADVSWLSQILAMGWESEPLGLPRRYDDEQLGAVSINIAPATLQHFWSKWGRYRTRIELQPLTDAA